MLTVRSCWRWILVLCLLLASTAPVHAVPFTPFGISFSPYTGIQNPNLGITISADQIHSRLLPLRGSSEWVRTFSVTHGMENAGALAKTLGFKTALGAWLGPESDASGVAANQAEIANLIATANAGQADMLIVGSEVLLRGDLSEQQLLDYVSQVRAGSPPGIPVLTADVYSVLLTHPGAHRCFRCRNGKLLSLLGRDKDRCSDVGVGCRL